MSLKTTKENYLLDNISRFDEFGFAVFTEGSVNAEDDERCHDYR